MASNPKTADVASLSARDRLALWIERSKLNQVEAARIIKIDPTQLSKILMGQRRPGLDNAVKIEQATGIVVEAWLPLGDDEAAAPPADTETSDRIGKA